MAHAQALNAGVATYLGTVRPSVGVAVSAVSGGQGTVNPRFGGLIPTSAGRKNSHGLFPLRECMASAWLSLLLSFPDPSPPLRVLDGRLQLGPFLPGLSPRPRTSLHPASNATLRLYI